MRLGGCRGFREAGDDYPAEGVILHEDGIDAFRRRVTALHGEFGEFSRDEFLRRAGVFSGKFLTLAGSLMFGEGMSVRAVLRHKGLCAEVEAVNIWGAYTEILPRLTGRLSYESAQKFRGGFVRALLNADYSLGRNILITITSGPARAVIDNPGILGKSGKNHRLRKIFALAGMLPCRKFFTPPEQTTQHRLSTTIPLAALPDALIR